MLSALLHIRVKQLSRAVAGLPFLYTCLLLVLLAVTIALCVQWLAQPTYATAVTLTACGTLCYLHTIREDRHFIRLISRKPSMLYAGEYFFLSLPVTLLLAIAGSWYVALAFNLTILLVSLWVGDAKSSRYAFSLARFALPPSLEWMAGLRKFGMSVILLWLTSLGLLVVPFASFISLLVLLAIGDKVTERESRHSLQAVLFAIATHTRPISFATLANGMACSFFHPHSKRRVVLRCFCEVRTLPAR